MIHSELLVPSPIGRIASPPKDEDNPGGNTSWLEQKSETGLAATRRCTCSPFQPLHCLSAFWKRCILNMILPVALAVPSVAFQISPMGPELHPDRSVTFTLEAPHAERVALWGDWMTSTAGVLMESTRTGWRSTTQPLNPGPHLYAFFVDGLRAADPQNRNVKNGYPGLSSIVEVPIAGASAPQGITHIHYYTSPETALQRTFRVYTPAHFQRRTRLPVVYLLHGSSDSDRDWLELGRAAEILEELVVRRRAKPTILVMLDGHPYPSLDVSTRAANLELLVSELGEIIMPLVDREYHPAKGAENRAIAGLSMGGAQALHLAAMHPGRFQTVAAFSAPGDVPGGATLLDAWRAAGGRAAPRFQLWCGASDPFYNEAKTAYDQLRSLGFTASWHETPGGHEWIAWRSHLAALLEGLFR